MVIKIGVLALQGDFALHHQIFEIIGIDSISVKKSSDLDNIDGLVIPGGESTTISLLIESFDMHQAIVNFGDKHPIMGTCAGMILMATKVDNKLIKPLGLVNMQIQRNAYGRQIDSRKEVVQFNFTKNHKIHLSTTLIRAPKIIGYDNNIHVLGRYDNLPVAILSGHHLCLSFHPELDNIDIFHRILFDSKSDLFYKKINQLNAA